MTGKGNDDVAISTASVIEQQAANWIQRRDFGGWNDSDDADLEVWLNQSLAHRVAFDRLDLGWLQAERLAALRHLRPALRAQSPETRAKPLLRGLAIAAVSGAIALAGWYALSAEWLTTYATSIGGREIIRLSDGSQIELNTDTAIRLSDRRDRREVWLDRGEAYFQIVHDAAHPFTVNIGDGRLTDLGTKFSVRRENDRLKVSVSEGGVRLDADSVQQPPKTIALRSGDVAIATPFGLSVSRKKSEALKEDLAWRSGVLIFHHTRIADAAAEFNRYNRRQIVVTDAAVADREIGGTFPTIDVEGFAEVSREVLHLRITKADNAIRISR